MFLNVFYEMFESYVLYILNGITHKTPEGTQWFAPARLAKHFVTSFSIY